MMKTPGSECGINSSFSLWNASRSIERLGGQKSLIVKLVTLFLRDAPEQIEQSSNGIGLKNYELSHIAIHSLKGTSSNLCTKNLEFICDDLLMALKKLDWEEAMAAQIKLSEEYKILRHELERFIEQ